MPREWPDDFIPWLVGCFLHSIVARNDMENIPAFDLATSGDPGSMDSLFYFVWKMKQ
jgi:hypothetical protein